MSFRVFTDQEVDQFVELGFVKLEEAIPHSTALAAQDFLWEQLSSRGVLKSNKETWNQPMVDIRETFDVSVFRSCMTERLQDAIEDLLGEGRWADRGKSIGWGWWPVNFSLGSGSSWNVPTGGWHWDGMQFLHTVTAPDQGLLLLPHFSEVAHHGGGTLVASGSHKIVAKFLANQSDPIELGEALAKCGKSHPWLAELTGVTNLSENRIADLMDRDFIDDDGVKLRVVETIASPGDVIFCHPFLYHAASQNHSGTPRFMCNRTTPLIEPMCFDRADNDYSPVEISIKRALSNRLAQSV